MADPTTAGLPSATDAEVAVARLEAMSSDLRGCVVLDSEGAALAASGDLDVWANAGREMLAAADTAAGERTNYAHVGTEDGEAFAVRHEGYAIVAACERFALASLMIFDLRSVLRDMVRDAGAASEASHARRAA